MMGNLSLIQEAEEYNEKDRSCTMKMQFLRKASSKDDSEKYGNGIYALPGNDMSFS
jgi:hypothetical protein